MRRLSPIQNEQFRQADSDSSGFVDLGEFALWHKKETQQQAAPIQLPQQPAAVAIAASPPPPDATFDNSFMRITTENARAQAKHAPPPPPLPSSNPHILPAEYKFDNSFMRTGGGGANAASAAPLTFAVGPTYRADPTCHPTLSAGFGGGAFTWGMTFKVESAAACCAACKAHAATCGEGKEGQPYYTRVFKGESKEEKCTKSMGSNEGDKAQAGKCNTWVYCPTPDANGGLCWSNDVWNHTYGECWLKHQADPSRPYAGAYQEYPAMYRKKHHTAPERVQWMSGVLSEKPPTVDGPHWHW